MTERVTLITGASAGIGTELARVFASKGHRVALVARRADRLTALADELGAKGGAAPIVIPCDLQQTDAGDRIAQGRAICLFPEGTRVPHGESPPLKAGFAGLYSLLGLPVVPIAIDSGRVSPRGKFLKRPGTITYKVLAQRGLITANTAGGRTIAIGANSSANAERA